MTFIRPRETHATLRMKDVQKRFHEVDDDRVESALGASKRTRYTTNTDTKTPSDHDVDLTAAVEASPASEGYTAYMEGLRRQKQVAQCLDQDLVRENARMRLLALHLKDEVDFYYRLLARIEFLVTQERRESEEKCNERHERVARLSKQIQRIINAPRRLDTAIQRASVV